MTEVNPEEGERMTPPSQRNTEFSDACPLGGFRKSDSVMETVLFFGLEPQDSGSIETQGNPQKQRLGKPEISRKGRGSNTRYVKGWHFRGHFFQGTCSLGTRGPRYWSSR